MKIKYVIATLLMFMSHEAMAQGNTTGLVVSSCGNQTFKAGNPGPFTVDLTGKICVNLGSGVGTVTSVSVTTANGVSGVVANPTTTPAITLTLGAITPTTVNGNTLTTGTGTLTLGSVTLNAGVGGTLGSNAFTSTAYLPLTGGTLTGGVSTNSQITSTLAIGTAPFAITSTTLVPNLYVQRSVLADSATTNANLTGPITSVGNATTLVTAQPDPHTWAAAQTINLNAASPPAAISGTALQVIGADSAIGRVQATSFGAIASFTAARANGTGASPTAILSGDQIGGFNAYSYVTSASPGFVGPITSYQTYATQNHTTTAMGSRIILATIPNNSTTLTTALTVDQDQSVAMAGRATAATSFAIGGATIGSNALAITGSYQQLGGNFLLDGAGFQLRDNPATTTYMRMIGGTGFQIGNAYYVGFSSTTNASGTIDTTLCRSSSGIIQIGASTGCASSGSINLTNITGGGYVMVGSATPLTLTSGAIGMQRMTASASAPGAAGTKFEAVCGTNSGTAKLVMYAGTSGTAVTVIDNVGAGVTGC